MENKENNLSEFLVRSISSVFIVGIQLAFIYLFNNLWSAVFLFVLAIFMSFEWSEMTITATNRNKFALLDVIYVSFTLLPMLFVKNMVSINGNHLLMWIFIFIWSVDTFAYICGKVLDLGRHKITKISPKKSYEGLIAGALGAMLCGYIFSSIFLPDLKVILLITTPLLAIIEQLSDIIESAIKRKFNVKDSGHIIPGHGGFLDRFDGFLLTVPAVIIVVELFLHLN